MSLFEQATTGTNTNPFPSSPFPASPAMASNQSTPNNHHHNHLNQQQVGDDITNNNINVVERCSESDGKGMKLNQGGNNNGNNISSNSHSNKHHSQHQGQGEQWLHHIDSDPDLNGTNSTLSSSNSHNNNLDNRCSNSNINTKIESKRQMETVAMTAIDMSGYPEDRNDDGHTNQYQQQQQQQHQSQLTSKGNNNVVRRTSPPPTATGVRANEHGRGNGMQGLKSQQQQQQYPTLPRQPLQRPGGGSQPPLRPQNSNGQQRDQQKLQRPKIQQQPQYPEHPPNHYGYDLKQQQLQKNQRQHQQPQQQQQPQQEPNRPVNSGGSVKALQHHPRTPKLIHVAPPQPQLQPKEHQHQQQQQRQQPKATTASPSPPPRKESLENQQQPQPQQASIDSVSQEQQVHLDDQARYRAMMMTANADSAVSLTGEIVEAEKTITNSGEDNGSGIDSVSGVTRWTESPSSQSLYSRSNSFSIPTTATSGAASITVAGTGPGAGAGIGILEGESPLTQPNPPFYPQNTTAGGGIKSRSGSLSSANGQPIRGPGWQLRNGAGGDTDSGGVRSVIVDMGMGISTFQQPLTRPPSPGKTGWEREDVTPTTPVPASQFQFLALRNNNGANGRRDSTSFATGGEPGGGSQGNHQHSNSLFDFFRGRKSSIQKNSTLHQQAAAAAAAAYAASSGSGSGPGADASSTGTEGHPLPALPLMGTPPPIARSRLGSVAALGPPVLPPPRKQSLDISALSGYHHNISGGGILGGGGPPRFDRHVAASSSSPAFGSTGGTPVTGAGTATGTGVEALTPTQAMDVITSSTIPPTPSSTATASASTSTTPSQTNTAQSTLSKVAAVVVGVTGVGKRRPSVVSELEAGIVGGGTFGPSKFRAKPPPVPASAAFQQQHQHQPYNNHYHALGNESSSRGATAAGLDAGQLQNHAQFMRSEKTMAELKEYIDRMYHTVTNKDVALEYSRTQISVLHKELDQNRVRSEDERKALTAEVDTVKEQVVKMEENFLLWRTKVHNDQMNHQEEFLQERLVKQDRIEELEEMLHNSQEEVNRLRNRLLVLEYEDGYVGPTAFLHDSYHLTLATSPSATLSPSSSDYDPMNPSTTIAIEHGPMTVNTHKRRSGDFKVMEQRAQVFEFQVQELKQMMEKQRAGHCQDLAELRAKLGARCTKLEHDVHAAKMESTVYNEMMHEVVTENDDLRQQVKEAQRKLRRHGLSQGHSGDSARSSVYNSNRSRRNQDYYGFPDDGGCGPDDSDDDDMEDIVI